MYKEINADAHPSKNPILINTAALKLMPPLVFRAMIINIIITTRTGIMYGLYTIDEQHTKDTQYHCSSLSAKSLYILLLSSVGFHYSELMLQIFQHGQQ